MENIKIYMYDNGTGVEIPEQIDVYPVELVLGSTVSEVHNTITSCQLFCVFTPISEADIIVQTKDDKDMMETVLRFGKQNFSVAVKDSSIWYSNKADKNILFSNTVNIPASELTAIIRLYLNEIKVKKKMDGKLKQKEIYTVINTRNSKVLAKTPFLDEAESVCNKNPCCIILNRANEQVYKSKFGKVSVPYTKSDFSSKYKSMNPNNNGIFKISQDL